MNCLVGKRQNEMLVGNEQKMPVYGKTGKIKWNGNDMEKFYTRGTTGGRRHQGTIIYYQRDGGWGNWDGM